MASGMVMVTIMFSTAMVLLVLRKVMVTLRVSPATRSPLP